MLSNCRLWIFIACLIVLASSATNITLGNCPAQYNLTAANQTNNGSLELVQFIYSELSSSEDVERIQEIILTGDIDGLDNFLNEKMLTYIIVAAVITPFFGIVIFYCLFDRNWPPCERFRRDPIAEPITVKERRCMVFWLLIFVLGILAAGVLSFTSIPKMKQYSDYTKCSLYNMLDTTINGNANSSWGGMTNLKYKIGNISSLLDSAGTQVSTYFANEQWLVNDLTNMKTINTEIYRQNMFSQLITPNPTTTETNLNAGLGFPMIDSVFIKTGMGPSGIFGTMVDDLERGLKITQIKSNQAYSIYESSKIMVLASDSIQINAVGATNTLSMYLRQLEVLKEEIDAFSKKYFDDSFSNFVYILQGVVGFIIVSSLLVLIGALSTHCYEILECRYMVHCGWFIYGLMSFGLLVLTFICLSYGSVAYTFCQYLNSTTTNQSSYIRIGQKYSQNALNRLDTCVLGDGDALTKFNIADQMRTVTQVFTNIQTYYDYDNPNSVNYIDLQISTSRITGWITAIDKYEKGIFIDSKPEQTNENNPNYAIDVLNSFTNPSSGGCSKDRWVFDRVNCTDPNQIIYIATGSDSNAETLSTNQVTCISFNEKFTTMMDTPWTHSDFARRYLQIRQDCPAIYDSIIRYGSTLINFRDSRINLFQGIKDDLNRMLKLNQDFNLVLASYRTKVDQFYQSVATLNNLITNQLNGLIVSSNCQTIGDQMKVTYNVLCVNFMGQIAKISICVLVLLFLMMCAVIVGSIFGVRHSQIQTLKRINGQQHQEVESSSSRDHPKKVDKQLIFSEQSHSSEDDQNDQNEKK